MVFVLNKDKTPLNPCHNGKAKWLLDNNYAVVHKIQPFTIRLKKKVTNPNLKDYTLKIDPGSKTTGLAINNGSQVAFLANLHHRADTIKQNLQTRREHRRFRRSQLKYREKRFDNRKRGDNWLPPSVDSIVNNIKTWVQRLKKLCPISKVVVEMVRFDTQKMQNPEIEGIEYQQGTLQGYNVREYLLYKHNHTCQYCGGESGDPVLEVEHKIPSSRGGTDSIKNLTLSCKTCNQDKDNRTLKEWLQDLKEQDFRKKLPKVRYKNVKQILESKVDISLKDAGRVNSYRYKLLDQLKSICSNIETSTGAKTKYNRNQVAELEKTHYFDALCVGTAKQEYSFQKGFKVLSIKATGRGTRQRTLLDKYGFPRAYRSRNKYVDNFKTGDLVKAVIPKGKNKGVYFARVSTRKSGYFRLDCFNGSKVDGVNSKYLNLLQRGAGYSYSFEDIA
ncbi:RNA-guided endonuclease IscB [Acetohalobium arabaticum]|uniref:HNH endonuclease n=1 Tax=Acetohalobium arabaticum (strain ATCC 49924 / DSM 5501 / Z-7288) TaxID=574087 RepID=D9QQ21_ACEAZ|nr:RNA-guided endonuclease IscB [Acetohalobium arabaticum]ADL12612.1 HNH endonuclease [Acetohalobium arabaticum DSM 5501]